MRLVAPVALLAVLVLARGGGAAGPPPSLDPSAPIGDPERKYRIVDELGRPAFCDPDFYPVARADESELAQSRFPEIEADAPTLRAILAHERMVVTLQFPTVYSAEQKVQIYRQWITVASRTQSLPAPCLICLAIGTIIDTPLGPRPVETLAVGDAIWTVAADGGRLTATVVARGSMPVPPEHRVVELMLGDGRTLRVSPGHPTADGRTVGALATGDAYDGSTIVSATLVRYGDGRTYDVLPSGATGWYWANGILLGSTLR